MSFLNRVAYQRKVYRNKISFGKRLQEQGRQGLKGNNIMKKSEFLEVKESYIHRFGCFAKRRIKKGTIIGEYLGKIIPESQSNIYDADDELTYLFDLENGSVIDATNYEFPLKYANHSCGPNAEAFQDGDQVFIEALRDIEPGEEITYDYNLISDDNVECRCGSKNCRGTMNRK